jgi:hypothetical protein
LFGERRVPSGGDISTAQRLPTGSVARPRSWRRCKSSCSRS